MLTLLLHVHKLVSVRRGSPVRICRCGLVALPEARIGENTITQSPGGVDVFRWSATKNAVVAGDIGMMQNVEGRPQAFVQGENRIIPGRSANVFGDNGRRGWIINPNANLTTLSQTGYTVAPTAEGTPSVVNVSSGEGQFIQYATGAVANNDGGLIAATFDQTQRVYEVISDFAWRTGNVAFGAASRMWIGLFSGDPMGSATPALHYAALRGDTGAGDVNWQYVTDDGSGVPTVTNSGQVIATTNSIRLRIILRAASVQFILRREGASLVTTTHVATLPGLTTNLGFVLQIRTLDATNRNIRFGRVQVTQRAA